MSIEEEEEEEQTAFLMNSSNIPTPKKEPPVEQRCSSSRGLFCCSLCAAAGRVSFSRRRCFPCFLFLVLAMSLILLPAAYRYAEQLAGDKPLQWRIDVYPDYDDDLWIGKSCEYSKRRGGGWNCRECNPRRKCHKLKPKGHCKPFRRDEWDPRSVSEFDPTSHSEIEVRTLTTLGRYHYHGQPQCTIASCFDLKKCSASNLTIYVNATGPHTLVDFAVETLSHVQRVDTYQDACLSVTFPNTYPSVAAMKSATHWHQTNGRNNLIYDMSRFKFNNTKRLSSDAPISLFHVGYAAVASESLTSAIFRTGYDLTLPLKRQWGRLTEGVDLHRPRKWLLTFRGTVKDRPQPYYQHRWLAAEYWEPADDVLVDVQCTRSKLLGAFQTTYKPYDDRSKTIYSDLMWNSTFGFAPGGSGVGSYRLGEVLSTGGIPVVTHDLVLPLAPEVDWTGCAVRVSEARIVDLPRQLRSMTQEEVRQRQTNCWRLLKIVIGDAENDKGVWTSQYQVTFAKAMEIWAARIANALEMRERLRQINKDL